MTLSKKLKPFVTDVQQTDAGLEHSRQRPQFVIGHWLRR